MSAAPLRQTHPPRRHRFTVADYYRMGEAGVISPEARVELIEGEIIDMAPIGSPHSGTVMFLTRAFHLNIGATATISVQGPLRLSDLSEPQPDLMLLQPRPDHYRHSHPGPADVLLLVEVAESSLAFDRDVKLPLYAAAGIPEVWIVDLNERALLRCTAPAGGRYQTVERLTGPSAPALAAIPGASVDLAGLFDF
jgi:Uma2 family endonuclease